MFDETEALQGADQRDADLSRGRLIQEYGELQTEWNVLAERQREALQQDAAVYDVRGLYKGQQRLSAIVEEMWRIQLRVNELSRHQRPASK